MKKIRKIGEGAFAQVWLMQKQSGEKVVVKHFQKDHIEQARREYLFLKTVASAQVVQVYGFNEEQGQLELEYVSGEKPEPFSNPAKHSVWMTHLASVISKIHSYGICYNDLKPDNVIDREGKPVLIDFGLATPARYQDGIFRGSLGYAAPEKIFFQTNSQAADVFSWALLYIYLISGNLPAEDLGLEVYKELLQDDEKWYSYIKKYIDNKLIVSCLALEPRKRPSMAEVTYELARENNLDLEYLEEELVSNKLFDAQHEAVRQLTETGRLNYDNADEIDKILDRAVLWAESTRKRAVILKETDYVWQPELFFGEISEEKIAEDEIEQLLQASASQIILVRDDPQIRTELFDKLAAKKEFWQLQKANYSDLGNVSQAEMKTFADQHQIEVGLEDYQPARPGFARIWLQSKIGVYASASQQTKDLILILSRMSAPLPLSLLQEIAKDNSLGEVLAQPEVSFQGDAIIYTGQKVSGELNLKFANELYDLAQKHKEIKTAMQLAFLLGEKQQALELLQENIENYIQLEYYNSAYQTLQVMKAKLGDLPLNLQKKEAFLLRKQGKLEAALNCYEAIEVDDKDMQFAVLAADKAVVLQELGRLAEAAEIYKNLLQIFKENNKNKDYLRTLNNLGVVEVQDNNFAGAQKTFLQLLETAQNYSDKQFITMAHLNLADVFLRQAEWKRSLLQAQTAAELGAKFGKKNIEIWAQIYGMQAQWGLGKFELLPQIIEKLIEDEQLQENAQLYCSLLITSLNIAAALEEKLSEKIYEIINTRQFQLTPDEKVEIFWYSIRTQNYYQANQLIEQLPNSYLQDLAAALLSSQQEQVLQKLQDLALQNDIFLLLNTAFQIMQSGLVDKIKFWPEINKYEQLHSFAPFQLIKKETQVASPKAGMDMLWEIISKIHSNETFQNTMQTVLAGIIKIGKLQRAVFFAFQEDNIEPVVGLNSELESIDMETLSISTTILQETLKLGETRYFYDLQEDIPFDIHSSIFGLGLRTAVCYPLIVNNRVEGVIYADTTNDRRFDEVEQNLLQTVFAQAKIALEKTKKIENLKTQQQRSLPDNQIFPEIIGNSIEMQQIYEVMKTVGEHNVNVLITGPTGSGKELIARALHNEYNAEAPFIPVNCAAIPENLLESELFGYAKGAFTGADRNRKGKIEAAHGGTLFLDEIAELPAVLQAKLLRVLQERVITPLGSNQEIPISIRLICATNQDIEAMVEKGSFRQDLFYRINVVSIKMPPLKDRKDDILPLAEYFLQRYNKKFGKNIKSISNDSARLLLNHNWPGNVRQLENLVEKAVLMSSGDFLEVQNLLKTDNLKLFSADEPIPSDWQEYKKYRKRFVDQLDRRFAKKIITENNGNIHRASQQAHIPRPQIYRILNKKVTEKQ